MSPKGRITIVTVTDNHYLILLAALLKSIEINHHSEEIIDMNIVGDHISDANRNKFNSSFRNQSINIIWHDMKSIMSKSVKLPADKTSYPLNIYMRLFFSAFIGEEVKRVLYLDVDMIVLSEISTLYHTDLKSFPIGAVLDPKIKTFDNSWGGIKNYKELGLDGNAAYFNTGLLLIDIDEWKKNNTTQKVIDCIEKNKSYLNYPDQYGLNVVFADNWFHIDPSWNTFAASAPDVLPNLIHFTERKPIYQSYTYSPEYQGIFFSFLKLTEWNDFKLIGENHRYLKKIDNVIKKWFSSKRSSRS
ncbi:glycosyltransferase family 8 protein [Pedobacter frigoris]|uniref:Glycosyltransferase family 8 protein n=1 Tax=Pedobacter frigoris TaxID=2571272 RepID=A0A4U1CN41_9SPHI|nr:glycosyltransferase family 8 protein [Pedobacter frigoris]TKC09331.1 glycosyltransferase family 8 protein [Pedobacter frigoris]